MKSTLEQAKKLVTVSGLAKAFNISPAAVSKWDIAPPERVIAIAAETGWKVTPHELRPDLYPHIHDGLPDHLRVAA